VLGVHIVDERLDANNPKFAVDLTIAYVGVKADIGMDKTGMQWRLCA
jgi:hypothetical protein